MTNSDWKATASHENLKIRAKLLRDIRQFFYDRNILEVETPLLCQHTVTDTHIDSFQSEYINSSVHKNYFLQTSPEYAMKRLLADNSGPIYQITKAFRNGEFGRQHNPEFSMLEWYQPDYTHHDLMQQCDEFLQYILQTKPAQKMSYRDLFIEHLDIDIAHCSDEDLRHILKTNNIKIESDHINHDSILQLLLSLLIEPKLGIEQPVFVYDYPITQAALAKIRKDNEWPVAERFELYINGVELANGFHELLDADEQLLRFQLDQKARATKHKSIPTVDHYFINALQHGLPHCSGIAIGIDRLMMILVNAKSMSEVISFPWDKA